MSHFAMIVTATIVSFAITGFLLWYFILRRGL